MSAKTELVSAAVKTFAEACVANGAAFVVLVAIPDHNGIVENVVRASKGMDDAENRERMANVYFDYMAQIMAGKITQNQNGGPKS